MTQSIVYIFVALIGGIGVFYHGSRVLSEGLQLLSGKIVKSFVITKKFSTPLVDFFKGALLTFLSFSPSMSSVVTLGLSYARLIKQKSVPAIFLGVILGTLFITGLLLLASKSAALVLIACGFLLRTIISGVVVKNIGKVFVGLGLCYFGIMLNVESFSVINRLELFQPIVSFLSALSPYYSNILVFCFGGAIAIFFAKSVVVIPLTIALFHFNIFSTWVLCSFFIGGIGASFILTYLTAKNDISGNSLKHLKTIIIIYLLSGLLCITLMPIVYGAHFKTYDYTGPLILSLIHLSFISLFLLLSARRLFEQTLSGPSKDELSYEQSRLLYMGRGKMITPSMAFIMVEMEVIKLMDIVDRMFKRSKDYLDSDEKRARSLAKIKDYERIIDNIQVEVDVFIEKVISSGIGEEDARESLRYLKIGNAIEEIADSLDKFVTTLTKYYEEWELSSIEKQEIGILFDEIYENYKRSFSIFSHLRNKDEDTEEVIQRLLTLKKVLLNEREEFAQKLEDCKDFRVIYYSDLMISLAKMRGSARDIYALVNL